MRRVEERRSARAVILLATSFVGCNTLLDNEPGRLREPATSTEPSAPSSDAGTGAQAPTPARDGGANQATPPAYEPPAPDAGTPRTPAPDEPAPEQPTTPVPEQPGTPVPEEPTPEEPVPEEPTPEEPVPEPGCPPGQNLCGGACVASVDPAFGCGSPACTPCAFPNAAATCAGACTMAACSAGFADCNASQADGCETDLALPTSCGACGVVCASGICTGDGICAPEPPPPPAEEPPAEQPPAEQPPAEQPPAEQPPAEQPPAEQPPADEPPAQGPPP